jgi:hypothetical protein
MATYNEPGRPLDFLLSEGNGQVSREQVTLAASQGALVPGAVLAKTTSNSQYVVYDNGSGTAGINVADAILCYDAANSGSTQTVTVIERLAEVNADLLGWGSNDGTGITAGKADLLAKNIKVRS